MKERKFRILETQGKFLVQNETDCMEYGFGPFDLFIFIYYIISKKPKPTIWATIYKGEFDTLELARNKVRELLTPDVIHEV